ncbi:MAG: arsenate reductase (glutaredoxin) [bacterium]|nr:arsenate reductase (glutaredoxin) [bacterium]
MKATIYHNPRCSKSRATFDLLREHNVDVEVIEYLQNPPTEVQLRELLGKLEMEAIDLVRKGESVYKELYSDKEMTEKELIEMMVENPILIERPIVVFGQKAVIGRPPENVLEFLK